MLKLSRHAKNNMRFYKITEDDINEVIEQAKIGLTEEGKCVAIKQIKNKFDNLPLKIVYTIEKDDKIVITAYPVRKFIKKEDK